jgi:hypothetical protein
MKKVISLPKIVLRAVAAMVLVLVAAVAVSQMEPGTRHIQVHDKAPFVTLSTP